MNQQQSVTYISRYLSANDYREFKTDPRILLQENRRTSKRKTNATKYGNIRFTRDTANRVHYEKSDLDNLCVNYLKPICEPLRQARLDKAEKAVLSCRVPYADD